MHCNEVKKKNLLSKERINKLDKLGMVWKNIQTWMDSYEIAKRHYFKYGDINLTESFLTLDGINISSFGFDITKWIMNQKKLYYDNKLSKDKIFLLEGLGIKWDYVKNDNNVLSWDQNYQLAKRYFEHCGNLKIVRTFRTFDGITYDKDGYNLGL